MKFEDIYHSFWSVIPLCLILLIPVLVVITVAEPAKGNKINLKENQLLTSGELCPSINAQSILLSFRITTSPDIISKKEVAMTNTDKLTEEEGKYLIAVARRTIEEELFGKKASKELEAELPGIFREQRGTFVTLTIGGSLRGCIGHIIPQESLIEGIKINAINAAFRDPRFRPVSGKEWKGVKIEISILTNPKSLPYADAGDLLAKLRPGIDGVIIKKGPYEATFLPQVWEQLAGKEEFLTHLCLKAGLDSDAWKKGDLEISIYQVQAFEDF